MPSPRHVAHRGGERGRDARCRRSGRWAPRRIAAETRFCTRPKQIGLRRDGAAECRAPRRPCRPRPGRRRRRRAASSRGDGQAASVASRKLRPCWLVSRWSSDGRRQRQRQLVDLLEGRAVAALARRDRRGSSRMASLRPSPRVQKIGQPGDKRRLVGDVAGLHRPFERVRIGIAADRDRTARARRRAAGSPRRCHAQRLLHGRIIHGHARDGGSARHARGDDRRRARAGTGRSTISTVAPSPRSISTST